MNSKKYDEIEKMLDELPKDEFYTMVTKANENLNLDDAYSVEMASEYIAKSNLNFELDYSLDLSKKNELSKAA